MRSVKTERIYLNDYKNIKELKDDINSYINFYNYIYISSNSKI